MLTLRQYIILNKISKTLKNKKVILGSEIHEKVKYPQYTVDITLKELHDQGYIKDVAGYGISDVHAIMIEPKGEYALYSFYIEHIKIILSRIMWMIIGSLITLAIQSIF